MAVDTKVYFESQTMNEVGRAMKKKCPKCGSIEESKFCTVCGQNLMGEDVVKICPTCGAETTRKFCTFCGTRLDQDNTGKVQNSEETAGGQPVKQMQKPDKFKISLFVIALNPQVRRESKRDAAAPGFMPGTAVFFIL